MEKTTKNVQEEAISLSRSAKKRRGRGAGYYVRRVLFYFFAVAMLAWFLFPVYCLLILSVFPDSELVRAPRLWPSYFNFKPYVTVFTGNYMWYFKNTFVVCAGYILGACISASLTAYAICKIRFKGAKVMFSIILATTFLPGVVTSIPLYVIYDKIGWTGTLYPLIIPIWFGGGTMNIFLLRQFMKGIPNSYTEAAIIDGAGPFRIFLQIIVPMITPILLYIAYCGFCACWNDFQGPLMYVAAKKSSWTVSLALYEDFAVSKGQNLANVQMAAGVIMMAPLVVLFALFQKQLIQGVATVGIKM